MMKIGGLQKVSLIDYPGKICATIFTQGCNFRCPYCHNPELVDPDLYGECQSEEGLLSFLAKRKGKLDAVSITGGEPTIQEEALIRFIGRVKRSGLLVKIDTNGSKPDVIKTIINDNLVDYIAMDVKGPLNKYPILTCSKVDVGSIQKSIAIVMASKIPYEFRTTVLKPQMDESDLFETVKLIRNARLYVLQQFVPSKTLDKNYAHQTTYSVEELNALKEKLTKQVQAVMIRAS